MIPHIQQKWIEALTNGSYIQTRIDLRLQARGILRDTDTEGYSIFGVLLDLYVDHNFDINHPVLWTGNKVILPSGMPLPADFFRKVARITNDEQIALLSLYEVPRQSFSQAAEFIASDFTSDLITFNSSYTFPNAKHALS